jgi:hypothetical protein
VRRLQARVERADDLAAELGHELQDVRVVRDLRGDHGREAVQRRAVEELGRQRGVVLAHVAVDADERVGVRGGRAPDDHARAARRLSISWITGP